MMSNQAGIGNIWSLLKQWTAAWETLGSLGNQTVKDPPDLRDEIIYTCVVHITSAMPFFGK